MNANEEMDTLGMPGPEAEVAQKCMEKELEEENRKQTGWPQHLVIIVSWFWKLEVQDRVVSRIGSLCELRGRICSRPFSSSSLLLAVFGFVL